MFQILAKRVSTVLAASLLVLVASAATEVPFKEKGAGTITSLAPGHLSFAGFGTATLLGKYTEVGSNDFDDQGNIQNGQFAITTKDGATISGVYSGTFAPLPSGQIEFHLTVFYTQGTGRLAGVTGQAQVVAVLDAVAPGAALQYQGLGSLALP